MDEAKNILVVHNKYKQKGGEDIVVENEIALLGEMGYTVYQYIRTNDEIDNMNFIKKICLPFTIVFSYKSYKEVLRIIKEKHVDILHVHNTLCVISPSVYYAGFRSKVPIFQTIHNFRLLCPSGLLLRDEKICTDCIDKSLVSAVCHKCYRNSFVQTLAIALMLKIHRLLGTYNRLNYICLSEFNKGQLLKLNSKKRINIKEEQIFVKPNFLNE